MYLQSIYRLNVIGSIPIQGLVAGLAENLEHCVVVVIAPPCKAVLRVFLAEDGLSTLGACELSGVIGVEFEEGILECLKFDDVVHCEI